jgi:hypothetical protein
MRCWAMKPVEMLERMAFGREGGPLFLTFKSVTQMPKSYRNCNSKKILEGNA